MNRYLLLMANLSVALMIHAQTNSNEIIGKWMTESGKAKIEIFESGNKYYGKIVWMKMPLDSNGNPKVDKHNPDPSKRKIRMVGLLLVRSMEYDGKGTWHNGTIYDPENGKEYKCKITKDQQGNLDLRGYIGVSLIGRTTVWKRTE